MRFPDLQSAGRDLARELEARGGAGPVVVLAVACGGVPAALEVSKRLGAPLDLVLIRRLLAPRGPEDPVCAVSVGGNLILDAELSAPRDGRDPALELFIAAALEEFARRERACRGSRPVVEIAGKTVLLIDNGIHTGGTIRIAVRAVRAAGAARVVVAVPVASTEGRAVVGPLADELICLASPEPFGHVGLWYTAFDRPADEQLPALLDQSTSAR